MSNIGSVTSYVPSVTAIKASQPNFGPVVTGVEDIAEAVGDTVSAVCSFSAASLGKLSDATEAGCETIGNALVEVGQMVGNAIDSAEDGAAQLYNEVAQMTEDGVDALGDAASSVADGISSAASSVAAYAAMGIAAGKQVISEIA